MSALNRRTARKESTARIHIATLGAQLAALTDRYNDLESAAWRLPKRDEQRRRLEAALSVCDERRDLVEQMICAIPAQTLAEAAVQIWQAFAYNDYVSASVFDRERDKSEMHERIARALSSALKVVAVAAGVDRDELFADVIDGPLDRFPAAEAGARATSAAEHAEIARAEPPGAAAR